MADKIDALFEDLQSRGFAKDKTREDFRNYMLAPGEQGYYNRKDFFEDFKSQGLTDLQSYEDFAQLIGLRGVPRKQQQSTQSASNSDFGFEPLDTSPETGLPYFMQKQAGMERRGNSSPEQVQADIKIGNMSRIVKGYATPEEQKKLQKHLGQRMDELEYEQETGNRMRQPVKDIQFEAPTISRDEYGNIRRDENGNPLIGFSTDEDVVNTHRQILADQAEWDALPESEKRERARESKLRAEMMDYKEPTLWDTVKRSLGSGIIRKGAEFLDLMQQLTSGMIVEDPSKPSGYMRTRSYDEALKDKNDPITRATDYLHETSERMSRQAQPHYGKGFLDMLWDGEIGNFLQKGIGTAFESLPNTLSIVNPLAMVANGMMMAGGNYREQVLENPDIPEWKRFSMAVGMAAIEQLTEKYSDPFFKYVRGSRLFKSLGKEASEEAMKNITKEATENIAKRIFQRLAHIGKDAVGEGAEEIISNFGSDTLGEMLDLIDGKKNYGLRAQWAERKKNNPDADLWEFAMEKAKEYSEAGIGGFMAGAYMSGSAQVSIKGLEYALGGKANADHIASNPNTRIDPATMEVAQSYDDGYSAEEPNDLKQFNDEAQMAEQNLPQYGEKFAKMVTESQSPVETLDYLMQNREYFTDEQIAAAADYFQKRSRIEGAMDGTLDRIDMQVEQANSEVRGNMHQDSGQVITAQIGDSAYYVIGGDVVTDEATGIPVVTGTGGAVVVKDALTGEVSVKSPQQIAVTSMTPADDMIRYNEEVLRQQLMQQADEDFTFGSPANEVYQLEDTVTLNDGEGNIIEGEIGMMPNAVDGVYVVYTPDGKALQYTADQLNRMIVAHNGQPIERTSQPPIAQNQAENAQTGENYAQNQPENIQSRDLDNAGAEASAENGTGADNAPASALSRIPVLTDEGGLPVLKKGRPQYQWHKASTEDAAAALIETTGGDMVMARDTASDLVKNSQAVLEKIRKQKPKGDDPIEIAESRMEIKRQEQEQQAIIKQWQDVNQAIQKQMRDEAAARQAEIEAKKSEEQRQREAAEAEERKKKQDEIDRQRIREQIEKDKERRNKEYQPLVDAREEMADDPDATAILSDTEPRSLEEWVSSLLRPHSMLWQDASQSEIGLQSELGLKRGDMQRMLTLLGTKESGAKPFGQVVLDIHEGLTDAMKDQYTDEDVRQTLLDLFSEGSSTRMLHLTEEHRIEEAREAYQENLRRAAEYELEQWAEAYHLTPEEREAFEDYLAQAPSEPEQEIINNILADESYRASTEEDQQSVSRTDVSGSQRGESQVQQTAETTGNGSDETGTSQATEGTTGESPVSDDTVSGEGSVIPTPKVDIPRFKAIRRKLANAYSAVDESRDPKSLQIVNEAAKEVRKYIDEGLDDYKEYEDGIEDYNGNDPEKLADQYITRVFHDRYADNDADEQYIRTGLKPDLRQHYAFVEYKGKQFESNNCYVCTNPNVIKNVDQRNIGYEIHTALSEKGWVGAFIANGSTYGAGGPVTAGWYDEYFETEEDCQAYHAQRALDYLKRQNDPKMKKYEVALQAIVDKVGKIFPRWEQNIPKVGINNSQGGNNQPATIKPSEQLKPIDLRDATRVESSEIGVAEANEKAKLQAKAKGWLTNENIEWAEGRDLEDIIERFGNDPEPIAVLPKIVRKNIPSLTDDYLYCGKAYFIDHHANHHPELDIEEYDNIQTILDSYDDIKDLSEGDNLKIAFVKKLDKGYAVVVELSKENNKIMLHKTFFYKDSAGKRIPFKNKPSIKEKWSVDGSTTISPDDNQQPADTENISALDQSSDGKDTNNSANLQEKTEKSSQELQNSFKRPGKDTPEGEILAKGGTKYYTEDGNVIYIVGSNIDKTKGARRYTCALYENEDDFKNGNEVTKFTIDQEDMRQNLSNGTYSKTQPAIQESKENTSKKSEKKRKPTADDFNGLQQGKRFVTPDGMIEIWSVNYDKLSVFDIDQEGNRSPKTRNIDTVDIADGLKDGTIVRVDAKKEPKRLVSDEKMEELRKKLLDKLNNLNAGIDPEMMLLGGMYAVGTIERGVTKFADYAREMIATLNDKIRPYLKAFYNTVRDMPEAAEYASQMDDYDTVARFDVYNFDKKQTPDAITKAEQVVKEQKIRKQANKIKQEQPDLFAGDLFGTPEETSSIGETSSPEQIASEEVKVDTNPTEAQKEAGNYQKGHIKVDGYDITIENPKGSVRRGTDANGKPWETTMHNTYGYIRGTEGIDGDHIDVFLSDDPTSGNVYVVDQINPGTGAFDEHKCMYGYGSEEEAREAYLANYSKGWKGLGNITEVSREDFKKWINSSHRKTKPFAEYKIAKKQKPNNAWWQDPNRPQSIDPSDYKTYTSDEAKAYFENFKSPDGKTDFTKWAHPNLAYITAAAWDGADIPVEELMQTPEIIEAEKQLRDGSLSITDEEKEQLANRLLDKEHGSAVYNERGKVTGYTGDVRQERKAYFVIGRPAGGKSSVFADPLSRDNGARIIDADIVKPWLQGYDDGNGAGYVQKASSDVMERALEIAAKNGDNMVIPKIGGGSVAELAVALRLAGYDVKLYYNDVLPETSYMRSSSRFAQSGRYLSLDYLTSIGGKISKFFSKFAEERIGDYINERTEEELQNVRGRFERLRGELDGTREGLWQLLGAKREGAETADGSLQGSLGSRELQDGGNGVQGLLNEPIFTYSEWKSNDVAFGEKPKEIWNSESGKPMPTNERINNETERKVSAKSGAAGEGTGQTSRSAGRTGTEPSPESDRAERSGSGSSVTQESAKPKQTPKHNNRRNNLGERGVDYAPTSPKARFNANVEAIKLMRLLNDEGIEAPTKDQMEVLRKYSGWGGMGTFFNDATTAEYRELRDLLSEEEYNDAAMSINSAYYTPAMVIDSLWDIAKEMGFKGGNVLEGSAGIGNIIGQMPKDMSSRSDIEAVEIDSISGNILKLLYPDAKVHIEGFQDVKIPNGTVDLAITNVPFVTGLHVIDKVDKDLSRKFTNIHDFCIAKNIRKLREGGIGLFITSAGTMDKSTKLREWITDEGQADVVGAFRLNNKTFGGTNVTSDIIVVRKRTNGQKSLVAIDITQASPLRIGSYEDKFGNEKQVSMVVNDYFRDHPEMMAGEMAFGYEKGDTFRPGSYGLYPVEGMDQNKMLADFAKSMSKAKEVAAPKQQTETETNQLTAEKEGRMLVDDNGRLCVSTRGVAVPLGLNDQKVKGYTKQECFADYQAVQKAVDDVLQQQLNDPDDAALKPKLDALNKAYDKFTKRYGTLHKNTSISFLRNDIDFPSFQALENYSETKDMKGKVTVKTAKTPLFTQRVLGFKTEPKPQSIKDALIASIFRTNGIDLEWIADKLNEAGVKPPHKDHWEVDDVRKGILVSRLGFEDPSTGQMEIRYKYLSGNVREKLAIAEGYNTDGKYNTNVEELRKVVPMDIPSHLIEFSLGSSWIPVELYKEYLKENYDLGNAKLSHVEGSWVLDEGYNFRNEKNRSAGVYSEKFRETIYGHQLVAAALNNRPVKVSKQVSVGYGDSKHTETRVDQAATSACAVRVDEIKDEFKQWAKKRMQEDQELAQRIEKIYNEKFNALVPMQIDEEFLPDIFEGANMNIHLYEHQKRGVMRGLTAPTMLAHEVGTGKSFTLISTAMEMRRLGTAKKPMIVVQNATVAQITSDAKLLYPNAKVLSLTERDRDAEGRRAFYAKIKYNDWDLIIVPQSTFERIPDSPERELQFIQEKIDEKKHVIEAAEAAGMDAREVSRLKRELDKIEQEYGDTFLDKDPANNAKKKKKDAKKEAASLDKAETKAKEMLDRAVDDVQYFDDLGVDALLVDEAHEYKHLGFQTSIGRGIKGIDPSYSKKCAGLYNKTRSVFEKAGWKNVVFATGTPISNTAAEIWTFMKYLMQPDVMRANDIYYFDDFVNNFGNISQMLEFSTSGKFKENTRFAAYVNKPELIRIWSQVADTVLTKEVGEVKQKVPKKEGDKDQDVFLPQSSSLISIMAAVRAELERFENMTGKEKKENSSIPLTMYGVAKRAAIDPRLVNPDAPDEPLSKTNAAVKEIVKDLKATQNYKGTVAVFCDNQNRKGADGSIEFNIYEDMRDKLIKEGVPAEQIAIVKSGMSITAKQKIFDAVNSGAIRVVLGSTQTLGTGVNMQERLHLLIHMDAPDRPMDYTQRNGRIERQGNLHKVWDKPIRIVRFGVEDSLDVTAYQRLKTKSGFIDSIMDGKGALLNNQVDRTVEEEEEGLFDNPVAVLSGSQYALKKNQAERELRKYQGKKAQWEADQVYITNTLRYNKSLISSTKDNIDKEEKKLTHIKSMFPDGKVKTITVEGTKIDITKDDGAKKLGEAIKEKINDPVNATVKKLRENQIYNDETQKYTIELDGHPVNFTVSIYRTSEWEGGKMKTILHKGTSYDSPDLQTSSMMSARSVRDYLDEIIDEVITGRDSQDRIDAMRAKIDRINSETEQMRQREGQPFQYDKELAEAKKHVEEYTELMKKEMEEKEAKYAAQQKEAQENGNTFDLNKAEDNSEDDDDVLRRSDDDYEDKVYSQPFKDFFGDWENDPENASKVVDEYGMPLVLHHGTNLSAVNKGNPFYVFKQGSHFGTQGQAEERISLGDGTSVKKIYNVYLNIRNPKRVRDVPKEWLDDEGLTHSEWWEKQIERAKYQGYDGLVYLNEYEDKENPADSWIAFYPEQIKSADENIGTYDRTNPDIRYRGIDLFDEGQTFPIHTTLGYSSYDVTGRRAMYSTELLIDEFPTLHSMLDAIRNQYPEYYATIEDGQLKMQSWVKVLTDAINAQVKSKGKESYTNRKTRQAINAVNQLAKMMNLDVEVLTSTEGLSEKNARSKGLFNRRTHKITIILPNHRTVSDVINTLMHEGVAHYGLRKMFGNHFETFLDNVYNNVDPEIKNTIDASIKRNGWSRHEATEEYLARIAEQTDFERAINSSWWIKIKNFFLDMLAKAGFSTSLSDNDLRYILWRSYENLIHPNVRRNIFDKAREVQIESRLKVGSYAPEIRRTAEIKAMREADEMGLFLRRSDDDWGDEYVEPFEENYDIARSIYEKAAASEALKFQEAWQDKMAGLKILQNAIEKETGKKATGAEDAYLYENRMHGKAKNQSETYDRKFYKPVLKAADNMMKAKGWTDIRQLTDYMVAKHGLERNIFYAFKEAVTGMVRDNINKEQRKLSQRYERGEIDALTYKKEQKEQQERESKDIAAKLMEVHNDPEHIRMKEDYEAGLITYADYITNEENLRRSYAPDFDDYYKDYSGLTELTGDEADYMTKALALVDDSERDAQKEVAQLWSAVNAATKETLRFAYESGTMSRNTYNNVRAMFEYYIPLRGWEENNADDYYDYVSERNVFSTAIKKAYGRKSLAENPIAYIGNMAVSTLLAGHRNLLKQHFLNYVMNNPTSLVSVSEKWFENKGTETSPYWVEVAPEIPADATADQIADIVEAFNEDMKQKAAEGKATTTRGSLQIAYHATGAEKNEHMVEVQRAGKTYQLYINGNPKAAQALNGINEKAVSRISQTDFGKLVEKINRNMAAFFTSKNPAFVLSNLSRDLTMAGASVAIKEDAEYNRRFIANVFKVLRPRIGKASRNNIYGRMTGGQAVTGLMPSLMRKYLDGDLDFNNETERLFGEFMDEGAETGFVNMLSVDSFKEQMQKEISHMQGVTLNIVKAKNGTKETPIGKGLRMMGDIFEFYNRCAEDATRFIVYMTSRQMGKSLEDSIADAKDVTLNFNRKGTGAKWNAVVRDLFIFVNPAIQALSNMFKMAYKHPVKFTAVTEAFIAGGLLMPVINQWLLNLFGDDDDKDSYWNLPPWVRKNNLVMWVPGTKNFITIPLAQEFRVFYGLGEMVSSLIYDHPVHDWPIEILSSFMDLIPINPTGNGGNLAVDLTPTTLQPLMQLHDNIDFTGKPIWKENQGNKYAPMYTKAYITTPEWMVGLSEVMNDLTGGNEGKKGVLEEYMWGGNYINNPAVWNHLMQGYFGGMYNTIAKSFDVAVTAGKGELPKIYQTPVINRFLNRPVERDNAGVLGEEYYKLTEERDRLKFELRTWQKKADDGDEDAQAHINEIMTSSDYQRMLIIDHYDKIMKDLKAGEKSATNDIDKSDIKESITLYKAEMMEELAAVDDGKDPLEAAMEKFNEAKSFSERNKLRMRIEKLMMRQSINTKKRGDDVAKALSYRDEEDNESRKVNELYLELATADNISDDARIRAAKAKIKPYTDEFKRLVDSGAGDKAAEYRKKHQKYFVASDIINQQSRTMTNNKKLLGKGHDAAIMKLIDANRNRILKAIEQIE